MGVRGFLTEIEDKEGWKWKDGEKKRIF